MFRQRLLTALVALPLLVSVIYSGGVWFALIIAAIAALGAIEFYGMVARSKVSPFIYCGAFLTAAFVLGRYYLQDTWLTQLLVTSAVALSLIWLAFHPRREQAFTSWVWTLAGMFYVGWMLSYLVALRQTENGMAWVFLALFAAFASDTSAFAVGKTWGRHLLIPAVSPKKTWEGAIGGVMGAVIISVIIATIFDDLHLGYTAAICLGVLISLFAQLGDLVESLLKRNMGVKDAGRLIPGHGGILDRTDSVVFVGALVYYYSIWAMG